MSSFLILQGCNLKEKDIYDEDIHIGDNFDKIENVVLEDEVISQINNSISILANKESEVIYECSCLDAIFGESYRKAFNDKGLYCNDVAIIDNNNLIDIDLDFSKYSLLLFRILVPGTGYSIKDFNLLKDRTEKKYHIDIDLNASGSGYAVITPLYYWQVYDNLDSSYTFKTNVKTP